MPAIPQAEFRISAFGFRIFPPAGRRTTETQRGTEDDTEYFLDRAS